MLSGDFSYCDWGSGVTAVSHAVLHTVGNKHGAAGVWLDVFDYVSEMVNVKTENQNVFYLHVKKYTSDHMTNTIYSGVDV